MGPRDDRAIVCQAKAGVSLVFSQKIGECARLCIIRPVD